MNFFSNDEKTVVELEQELSISCLLYRQVLSMVFCPRF